MFETYHKRVIFKTMSQVEVTDKVSTLLSWISPWHCGTDWANLMIEPNVFTSVFQAVLMLQGAVLS